MQSYVSLGLGSGNGTPLIALFFSEAAASDTTPDAFSFTDQSGVALSSTITSASITPTGYDTATTISITGGTYSINGGAYTGTSGTLSPGDSVTVRHTSSGSYLTATNTVLTVGGVSDTFTSTTLAEEGTDVFMKITFVDRLIGRGVAELSGVPVVVKFWDDSVETWTATTPTSVKWRVDDIRGGQITDWTTVTPAASVTINIPGSTNAIIDDCRSYEMKQLTVRANDGLSTQCQHTYVYKVRNLSGQ